MASISMSDFTLLYSNYNHFQKRIADELFNSYLKELDCNQEDLILDVGCSSGDVTHSLLNFLPNTSKLIALDLSEESIEDAKILNPDPKIEYIVSDITNRKSLPQMWEEKFDVVFSLQTLHWLLHQDSALRNICWCLKPNGKCFFTLASRTNILFIKTLIKFIRSPAWKPCLQEDVVNKVEAFIDAHMENTWMHSENPEKTYAEIMHRAGLNTIFTALEIKTHECDFEEYKGMITVTNPLMCGVPEEKKEEFANEFAIEMCLGTKISAKGDYIIEYPILIMIGEKK